jgi:DNA-binding GntR family transcriptional regulator
MAVGMVYNAYHMGARLATKKSPLDGLRARATDRGGAHKIDVAITPIIREAIISGALAPGVRLSEGPLARKLGVSRTPVRQALVQLEHERLVVIVPHFGASVRTITADDVREIYEVRIAMEALATKLAMARLTPVGKAELNEAATRLREADGSQEDFAEVLDALHLLIIRLSQNRTLQQMYESLVGPIRRFRRIDLRVPNHIQRSLRGNLKITKAIVAGDAAAPDLIEEHLRRACADILMVLEARPTVERAT